jgi:hypothetical protein
MNTYLLALGWWNFFGSLFMLTFFNEAFGKKVLNEWTKIFSVPFTLDYWSKFWLAWAIGLNIFFALINIYSVKWELMPLKTFCVIFDLISYSAFTCLAIWGIKSKRTGSGIYSVFIIFSGWILWGAYVLFTNL